MKKHTKRLISLVLTFVMVFAMTATAFAAEGDHTITVNSSDDRTYAVYQIFTGDLYGDVLSNIKWGANGTEEAGTAVDPTIITELEGVNGLEDPVAKLDVIKKYVDFSKDEIGTVSNENSMEVPAGYYLFADVTEDVTSGEAHSLYVVNIVKSTEITPKKGQVQSYKKVDDKNDSTGLEDAIVWQDSADYDMGDAVPFQLTGIVSEDYANYKTYYFAFHDTECEGLTFMPESVTVYVDGQKIETGFEVVTEGLENGETFEVVFEDLKQIDAVTANSVITVEYTSTLNTDAKVGAEGNPNVMYVEYSNNPNWEAAWGNDGIDNDKDGETDEEDEQEGPTGETPEDKVIVFTYKVVVNKVDENEVPLQGAGFTLFKKNVDGEYVAIGEELVGGEMTTFSWVGVDDGEYKVEETTTPAGYNTIPAIEFTITATHEEEAANPTLTSLNNGDLYTGEAFIGSTESGEVTETVVNQSGTVLPETGGIGTTMIYVVGAVLVLGASVILVSKRRAA